MPSKWPDFLFAVAVRSLCGAMAGALISVPILFFAGRGPKARRTSLLVEWINAENYLALGLWFGGWALAGAILAVQAIPKWKTPWYKSERWNDDDGDGIRIIEDE